jgi:hypothetical protein
MRDFALSTCRRVWDKHSRVRSTRRRVVAPNGEAVGGRAEQRKLRSRWSGACDGETS